MRNEANSPNAGLQARVDGVRKTLRELKSVVVSFSAGVDSTLLLALAAEELGPARAVAAMGISPSLPQRERQSGHRLAEQIGVKLVEIGTGEADNPNYAANPANRCYFCKKELFTSLGRLRDSLGFHAVIAGVNADDTGDFRPGLKAGRELGVRNPLLEAGLTKAEIREVSRSMGLPTWDKPAMACLASRVPYGSPITPDRLGRIERAEDCLRDAGFRQVRVRDHDQVARIEVPVGEQPRLMELREQVLRGLKALGYVYVAVDLEGFRSGSSNEVLKL